MKKRICAAAVSLSLCASMAFGSGALDVEKARELLGEHYISALPAAAMQAQTVEELLAALNDPYTIYYSDQEYSDFLTAVNGEQVVGIGVSIQTDFSNGFRILSVLPDSPALEAGLKSGDVIIAVDGVALTPQTDITARIGGNVGTPLTVTVRRGDSAVLNFTMERRLVQIPIVTFEDRGDLGWLDCSSFGASTPTGVQSALTQAQNDVTLWVMDLRANPGGTSDSAAVTATHFAGGGVMAYFRDGQESYFATYTSPANPDLTDKPLVILLSRSSASASELFSGTIRDYDSGIGIGQRTYGKGVAQIVLDDKTDPEFFQGDSLKLTAYQFFSPDGLTCHLMGVLPSLVLDNADIPGVLELLSFPQPTHAQGWLKLEMAGQSFYLQPQACHDDPDTFGALLEAIPPAARLYRGYERDEWVPITPAEAAEWRGANYTPRTFSDVVDSPYRQAIETLACYDLITGDKAGRFLPQNTLTRGELCAMLASAFQLPAGGVLSFSDVAEDAWYAPAVSALVSRGFMVGTGDGTFRPDAPVTNQELCTVLYAIASWANMHAQDLRDLTIPASQWLTFYDFPEWAKSPAYDLTLLDVSVDTEHPAAPVTREQCAGMLYELMESLGMFWY